MANTFQDLKKEIKALKNPTHAKAASRYFKTGKGEYGEGDVFIGIRSPDLRSLSKKYWELPKSAIIDLVSSKIHEERLLGLFILVIQFKKSKTEAEEKRVYNTYVRQFKYINNWDLVDTTAPHLIGSYLLNRDRSVLYKWVKSSNLWVRRISIISSMWFIRKGDVEDSIRLAEILLFDEQDLIHKAVGWALREVGKKDLGALKSFIKTHYEDMPRTMLRYSIEKFPEKERKAYLKGTF